MGCGSPVGDLFYLADRLLDPASHRGWGVEGAGWSGESPSTLHTSRSPHEGLRAQLYQMHGDGEMAEEVFTALRALADRGELRPADLAVHRARAQRWPAGHGRSPSGDGDVTLANALRGIRARLAQLAQVRASSTNVLADLEARLDGLDERIAGKEQAARAIVERDEGVARQRLADKAEFANSRDRLAAQARALQADLAALDDLRAQLEAKALELEAVQARSRLSEEVLK